MPLASAPFLRVAHVVVLGVVAFGRGGREFTMRLPASLPDLVVRIGVREACAAVVIDVRVLGDRVLVPAPEARARRRRLVVPVEALRAPQGLVSRMRFQPSLFNALQHALDGLLPFVLPSLQGQALLRREVEARPHHERVSGSQLDLPLDRAAWRCRAGAIVLPP
jgi:hypothetical protein